MSEQDQDDRRSRELELLSIIAHDVKNGLNVINLGAHQLSSVRNVDSEVSTRLKRVAEMLTRASKRMGELMRDVVDLARLDTGSFSIEPKRFAIDRAIGDAVELHLREAEERQVSIEVMPSAPLHANGDPERTSNVVSILVNNAIRASPANGRVRITALADNDFVRIEVRDEGPGIEPHRLDGVFRRRSPTRGDKSTLGRGLPLAYGVVLAQGGTIGVESQTSGSCAYFTIPRAQS